MGVAGGDWPNWSFPPILIHDVIVGCLARMYNLSAPIDAMCDSGDCWFCIRCLFRYTECVFAQNYIFCSLEMLRVLSFGSHMSVWAAQAHTIDGS